MPACQRRREENAAMNNRSVWITVFLVSVCASAMATRPFAVDDAFLVVEQGLQVEAGLSFIHRETVDRLALPVNVAYGVTESFELDLGCGLVYRDAEVGGENDRDAGNSDLTLSGKYQLTTWDGARPAQALTPSVKIPLADEDRGLGSGEPDYDLTWSASWLIVDLIGVHANLGFTLLGTEGGDFTDRIHYGIATDVKIVEGFKALGELFATDTFADGAGEQWQYKVGAKWMAAPGLAMDAAVGSKVSENGPDFTATIGLTWEIPAQ